MKNERLIWTIVFAFGAIGLVVCAIRGTGRSYVSVEETAYYQYETPPAAADEEPAVSWHAEDAEVAVGAERTDLPPISLTSVRESTPASYRQEQQALEAGTISEQRLYFSMSRTIGVWIAALLTLCILSFLWGDNPFYKTAESIVVGTSAAYIMVTAFWNTLVKNLFGNLIPGVVKSTTDPGLDSEFNWIYIFPLILCIMLLMRLSPKGGWIARWPLAFFIGATAGFRLIGHLESDFVEQIRSTLIPLVEREDGSYDFWGSVGNIVIIFGVMTTLVYFFFSFEHKGVVGKTARTGIFFLMITFGAAFGYTVMGRIALIAQRFEFLVDDWLWIIDPTGKRTALMLFGL